MPNKPRRPCRHPGCKSFAEDGEQYCKEHKKETEQIYNRYQRPGNKKAYGRAWKRIRDRQIKEHPLCEDCLAKGISKTAEEVHHIIPVSEGGSSERSNLVSLCRSCHLKRHGQMGDRRVHKNGV